MDGTPTECADLASVAAEAWAAFRDAEVAQARQQVDRALAARACQTAPVPHDTLLDLYRLDALLGLTSGGADTLTAATIRAVVAGPDEPPPAKFGTELLDHWNVWSGRLGSLRATLAVDGAGTVFADGLPITASTPRSIVQGEHVLQVTDAGGALLAVRLVDVTADVTVPTPGPTPMAPGPALPLAGAPPLPDRPLPDRPLPDRPTPARRHPAWAFALAGGGAALAGGGGAYAWWLDEGCAKQVADPLQCAETRPFVNAWLAAAVAGGALSLSGATLGIVGLPAKE